MATILETKTREECIDTNEFNKPKVVEGRAAISTILVRLILCEPGTYSNRPLLGVGLISKYRYCGEKDMEQLQKDIESQITTYLPEFSAVDVSAYMNDITKNITLDLNVDGVLYRYETVRQEDNRIGLTDLKL